MVNGNDVERLDELVSSFDFKDAIGRSGGSMVIQLDEKKLRTYGFGELLLLPYLQRAFNRDEDLTVGLLRKRIGKSSILTDSLVDDGRTPFYKGNPFYKQILKKLNRDEIIQLTLHAPMMNAETGILEGQNYFRARVRKIMRSYGGDLQTTPKNEANM
jgi:hypothetical protein